MSRFAGQMSRPWVGMPGSGTASEPTADVARDDATAAAAGSSMRGTDAATNASAISFGFAATAVLVSMFLLMAIFEHLIKPGLASSSSTTSRGSSGSHDDADDADDFGEGRGHGHGRRLGLPPARLRERDASSPDKLGHSPKVEPVVDLTVLMPGQRYPTFLAQPAPLAPCPREAVLWPSHDHRRSFVPLPP